ncbi:fluoride efflux transporter CrcB [Mycoplasmatota bacterium]|nr:fluoride efflux transporter CrcB [Mycoplasmatota bacterium]
MIYITVGIFGIIGALIRYYLGVTINTWWVYSFPLGTLIINCLGALILGWFTYSITKSKCPEWFRLGFGVGLIGSFTTFSTFSVETLTLLNSGLIFYAFMYVLLSLLGGLFFSLLGYKISLHMRKGVGIKHAD